MIYAERVEAIYLDCLYRMDDETRMYWTVINPNGVHVGFNPARVGQHLADIESILSMFPPKFYEVNGPGAPLSEACHDYTGKMWASDLDQVVMIFVLGMAIGRVKIFKNPENYDFMWVQII